MHLKHQHVFILVTRATEDHGIIKVGATHGIMSTPKASVKGVVAGALHVNVGLAGCTRSCCIWIVGTGSVIRLEGLFEENNFKPFMTMLL